ncbi:MAG: hypothetical protein J7L07_05230 [Candidatus Odinarchaeota archaeon]|nr:hypothetical protein [Candidatus Odinarchaeota archaeon]
MRIIDALITAIFYADELIHGRTVIQKLLYFAFVKNLIKTVYVPHYYGPYSVDVYNSLVKANLFNFVKEEVILGENWVRYDYYLTEDGRKFARDVETLNPDESKILKRIIITCKSHADLDYKKLADAAKLHFVIAAGDLRVDELDDFTKVKKAFSLYGWSLLDIGAVHNAEDLLKALSLI